MCVRFLFYFFGGGGLRLCVCACTRRKLDENRERVKFIVPSSRVGRRGMASAVSRSGMEGGALHCWFVGWSCVEEGFVDFCYMV